MPQANDSSDGDAVVLVEHRDTGVAIVTLNRPNRLNALTVGLVAELHRVFDELNRAPEVLAIVFTGAGRGFCSGADIKGDSDSSALPAPIADGAVPLLLEAQEQIASLHERINRLRKPVIAAVNGIAVGGGFSLTLACDIRIAADTARFGAVFITLGISSCDMGTSYFLPRLVGASRSAELMLTGRIFDASEAEKIGLVLETVPGDQLLDRAIELAEQIAAHTPLAVWMTKETMWQNLNAPSLRAAMDMENRTQVMCLATGEMARASDAFGSP